LVVVRSVVSPWSSALFDELSSAGGGFVAGETG
jgi:hypothetical protein